MYIYELNISFSTTVRQIYKHSGSDLCVQVPTGQWFVCSSTDRAMSLFCNDDLAGAPMCPRTDVSTYDVGTFLHV